MIVQCAGGCGRLVPVPGTTFVYSGVTPSSLYLGFCQYCRVAQKAKAAIDPKEFEQGRALTLLINHRLQQRYGRIPVRVETEPSAMMRGLNVTVGVPGQTRTVFISQKSLDTLSADPQVEEQVLDEVLFAVFLLLDEDDEDI